MLGGAALLDKSVPAVYKIQGSQGTRFYKPLALNCHLPAMEVYKNQSPTSQQHKQTQQQQQQQEKYDHRLVNIERQRCNNGKRQWRDTTADRQNRLSGRACEHTKTYGMSLAHLGHAITKRTFLKMHTHTNRLRTRLASYNHLGARAQF